MQFYILDIHKCPQRATKEQWLEWLALKKHLIASEYIRTTNEWAIVSTIFTGVPKRYLMLGNKASGDGLFETIIISNSDQLRWRGYSHWHEAVEGHRLVVKSVSMRMDRSRYDYRGLIE